MARNMKCPHLDNIIQLSLSTLSKLKQNKPCSQCDTNGPNLWICLQKNCLHIGCSEQCNDHSTAHFKSNNSHCVHMNLSSQRIWCYLCESEVFLNTTQRRNSLLSNESSDTTSRYSNAEKLILYDKGGGGESCESSGEEDETEPNHLNGLVGLQNIANTCYMNAALQALSNSPPLTGYFLDCGAILEANNDLMCNQGNRTKPGIAKSYHRLIREMWCKNRRNNGYVVPSGILYGIRIVHPMFRGFQQHDTQEFLRCFMDQLHEELKEVTPPPPDLPFNNYDNDSPCSSPSPSQSEAEYETCDSGVSEQSSLSDDNSTNNKNTRSKSRSPSPTQNQRNINNITNNSVKPQSSIVNNRNNSNSSLNSTTQLNALNNNNSNTQPNQKLSTASVASSSNSQDSSSNRNTAAKHPHRSIISDIFDGKLLSSVQCLTCDRISTREETFQDLSLPIPGKDHLAVLHQNQSMPTLATFQASVTCSDAVYQAAQDGWMLWLWNWFRSWFWGPAVSLHDCLAAFFSADELKGDNMYSCEKCNKLRNGVKFSRVMALPEMLCVHLKRFRHDLSYSSKISSPVHFPLTGLEMRPYLHKDCNSEVSTYDLCAIICHHGTVGSGHYTSFAKHEPTGKWFEYDDQLVTQVTPEVVQTCEAYVLFYRKNNPKMTMIRSQALQLVDMHPQQASDIRFYVSRQWLNRFNTFAEPGPIDNWALLCSHGGLPPCKGDIASSLVVPLPQPLWDFLYKKFGGGPACNHLFICGLCRRAAETLSRRQKNELEQFTAYNDEFQYQDSPTTIYAISMAWFRQWQLFARGSTNDEPGAINNTSIAPTSSDSLPIRNVRPGSDYAQINSNLWKFFHDIYGGGPEIILRGNAPEVSVQRNNSGSITTEDNSKISKGSAASTAGVLISPEKSDGELDDTLPIEESEALKKQTIPQLVKDVSDIQINSNSTNVKDPAAKVGVNPSAVADALAPLQNNVLVKPVKSVSFEDSEMLSQNDGSSVDSKSGTNNNGTSKNPSNNVSPLEIGGKRERRHRSGMKSSGLFGVEGKYSDLKYQNNSSEANTNNNVNSSTNSNSSNNIKSSPPPAGIANNNDSFKQIDEVMPLLLPTANNSAGDGCPDTFDQDEDDEFSDSKHNQSQHNQNHHNHHHNSKKSNKNFDNQNSGTFAISKHSNRKKLKTKYSSKKIGAHLQQPQPQQQQHSVADTNSDSEK